MKTTASYLSMLQTICQFKAKDYEIKDYKLCLGKIPEVFVINNIKKQD